MFIKASRQGLDKMWHKLVFYNILHPSQCTLKCNFKIQTGDSQEKAQEPLQLCDFITSIAFFFHTALGTSSKIGDNEEPFMIPICILKTNSNNGIRGTILSVRNNYKLRMKEKRHQQKLQGK